MSSEELEQWTEKTSELRDLYDETGDDKYYDQLESMTGKFITPVSTEHTFTKIKNNKLMKHWFAEGIGGGEEEWEGPKNTTDEAREIVLAMQKQYQ